MNKLKSILLLCCLLLVVVSCQFTQQGVERKKQVNNPALLDSLQQAFFLISEAVNKGDKQEFMKLLDPTETASLQRLAQRRGYSSLASYLTYQFINWPKLDTLSFWELKTAGRYARVTYVGGGTKLSSKKPRRRYTFLLFHQQKNCWKLAAMSEMERPKYDMYGYAITIHETDLPPKLRFPRI